MGWAVRARSRAEKLALLVLSIETAFKLKESAWGEASCKNDTVIDDMSVNLT